jgi:putative ABC transport system ATP-binding protein
MAKSKKSPQDPPVIQLVNLTKQFGHDDTLTTALDGINLTIEKGEFVAIMGPSGCGKTTLLNILGLLDTPTEGQYSLDSKDVSEISHRQRAKIRGTQIGFVFQSFNLLSRMNIIDNVAMPLTYRHGLRHHQLKKASDMLKTFELQEREYYMPHQLSGGQLQRVAIARALVNEPSMILADEPTGNLDSKSSELIMNELRDIHERGNTIIMVTHNPDLTVYATRILHMKDGKIATDTKKPKKKRNPRRKRRLDSNRKKKTEESVLKKAVTLAYDGEDA